MSNFRKVGTFMKTFGQEVKTKPSFSTEKINKLRIDLIKEEFITMYSYSNFFEVIERMLVTNPDNFNHNQPKLGSLDIREVKNSDYFFA